MEQQRGPDTVVSEVYNDEDKAQLRRRISNYLIVDKEEIGFYTFNLAAISVYINYSFVKMDINTYIY